MTRLTTQVIFYTFLFIGICTNLVASQNNNEDAIPQSDVPALLFSHKLVLDIPNLPDEYDHISTLPKKKFLDLAGDVINSCSFDTFILINQPGLKRTDFSNFPDSFVSLRNYVSLSSTAFRFEKVQLLENSTYNGFIQDLEDVCDIEKIIHLNTDNKDSFQPYVDSTKRIIRIDLAELPDNTETDPAARSNQILENDKYIRSIMGKIPSPYHAVIYTSLNPTTLTQFEYVSPARIFSDVFTSSDFYKGGVEKNNRKFELPPTVISYRPKFDGMTEQYVSLFDNQFLDEHLDLIKIIVTVFSIFIIQQIYSMTKSNSNQLTKETETKKNAKSKQVEKCSKTVEQINDKQDDVHESQPIQRKKK